MDCKGGSRKIRGTVHQQGNYYLCPLSETQLPHNWKDTYVKPAIEDPQKLVSIHRENSKRQINEIAQGYEIKRDMSINLASGTVEYKERLLVIHSPNHAKSGAMTIDGSITRSIDEINKTNERKQGKKVLNMDETRAAVASILKKNKVGQFIQVTYEEVDPSYESEKQTRKTRKTTKKPSAVHIYAKAVVNKELVDDAKKLLGWKIYACNKPAEDFTIEDAVQAYRDQYIIEKKGFGRYKGTVVLEPMYLSRQDHIIGLIRLLSLGLKNLSMIETMMQEELKKRNEKLPDPKALTSRSKASATPTAERIMQFLKGITMSFSMEDGKKKARVYLNEYQKRILDLLGFPIEIYTQYEGNVPLPHIS
jgi:transposase